MKLELAEKIAINILDKLSPHCEQVIIAGSIRRRKPEVKDIEFVLLAKPYEVGFFQNGIADAINSFKFIKGILPCKYAQRSVSVGLHGPYEEIKIDFFFADEFNIGWIKALRTGSKEFNFKYLAEGKARGYEFNNGYIWSKGKKMLVPDEENLYLRLGMKYVNPENRI